LALRSGYEFEWGWLPRIGNLQTFLKFANKLGEAERLVIQFQCICIPTMLAKIRGCLFPCLYQHMLGAKII